MRFPSKEVMAGLRERFPAGCRVRLVRMDDVQAPPAGTHGTVTGVDDAGSVMVRWDNGSGLSAVYGADIVERLDTVTTVCGGVERIWDSRKEAANFFLEAVASTEGSECERYANVYAKLLSGAAFCTDSPD